MVYNLKMDKATLFPPIQPQQNTDLAEPEPQPEETELTERNKKEFWIFVAVLVFLLLILGYFNWDQIRNAFK